MKRVNATKELNVPGANGRYPIKPRVAIYFRTTNLFCNYLVSEANFCRSVESGFNRAVFVH